MNLTNLLKRKKLLALVVILLIAVGLVLIVKSGGSSNKAPDIASHDAGIVAVDDKGLLQNVLFDLQYYAVAQAISDYVQADINKYAKQAQIVGEPGFPQNGIITATFQTDKPKQKFTIRIDRTVDFDKLDFSVPESNYHKTLQVYQRDTDSDQSDQDALPKS